MAQKGDKNQDSKLFYTLLTVWVFGCDWSVHLYEWPLPDLVLGGDAEEVRVVLHEFHHGVLQLLRISRQLPREAVGVTLLDDVGLDVAAAIVLRFHVLDTDAVLTDVCDSKVAWWARLIWKND